MKLKRFAVLLLSLLFLPVLSSCTYLRANLNWPHLESLLLPDNEDEIAATQFRDIWGAIKTQDTEKLLEMFSPNVRREVPNLAEQADALFELVHGEVVSRNDRDCMSSDAHYHGDGTSTKILYSGYDITTSEYIYRFYIVSCYHDTADPDSVGLHSLFVMPIPVDQATWRIEIAYHGVYHEDGSYDPGITIDEYFAWKT